MNGGRGDSTQSFRVAPYVFPLIGRFGKYTILSSIVAATSHKAIFPNVSIELDLAPFSTSICTATTLCSNPLIFSTSPFSNPSSIPNSLLSAPFAAKT